MRHQTGAGGEGVAELDEAEFARAPGDQIFAQTRQMHSDNRKTEKEFAGKIAIADSVETVLTDARETKLTRNRLSIEHDGRSRERAGTKRKNIGSSPAIAEALDIALECFDLREQVMREKDRLRPLQMGVARHDNIDMLAREIEQCGLQ